MEHINAFRLNLLFNKFDFNNPYHAIKNEYDKIIKWFCHYFLHKILLKYWRGSYEEKRIYKNNK
jgi:hypothetical protein